MFSKHSTDRVAWLDLFQHGSNASHTQYWSARLSAVDADRNGSELFAVLVMLRRCGQTLKDIRFFTQDPDDLLGNIAM